MRTGEEGAGKGAKQPKNQDQQEKQDDTRNLVIQTVDANNIPPTTRTDELYVVPGLTRGKST
jgi:hypothetical protein